MTTSALTARDLELLKMPSIETQMPIAFANGAVWTEFDGYCLGCNSKMPRDTIFGAINRPIPSTAVIEAIGVCKPCRLASRYDYRFHDDMRITGQRDDGWQTWKSEPTLAARCIRLIKNNFRKFHG